MGGPSPSLDLGIIKNFRMHYSTCLLQFVASKIETCTTASEVTKNIKFMLLVTSDADVQVKMVVDECNNAP